MTRDWAHRFGFPQSPQQDSCQRRCGEMSLGIQQPFSYNFNTLGSLFPYPSRAIAIDHVFNNQAASGSGAIADFDGQGASYDAQFLPNGSWVYEGINVSHDQ